MDQQYRDLNYKTQTLEHKYGDNVHILSNPYWLTLLNRFSADKYQQPMLNMLVREMYTYLCSEAMGTLLGLKEISIETRMAATTDKGVCHGMMIDPGTRIVCVDLARAGILPTQTCFENLSMLVSHENVRQDHFYINRRTNSRDEVVGVDVSGSKIGGDKEKAWVLFPDPMGATGGSLSYAIHHYKDKIEGSALGFVAMHLIITPEYIKRMQKDHPDAHIFALRLDRGLSPDNVMEKLPGVLWDQERGLTDKQYIVPGAGGVGEVLNNSYV